MIHLYAFAHGLSHLPPVEGVGGAPTERHDLDGLTAVVSRHERLPGEARREDVVAHGLVVEVVNEVADAVLPVRFGQTFEDDALAAAVSSRLPELRRQLDHVRGAVEIAVRVLGPAGDGTVAAGDGRAYMEARLAALAERDGIDSELHGPLERLARAARPRVDGSSAYLVERADVDAVRAHVAQFIAAHPDVTVVCTGPWAPYSFAAEVE